MANETKTCTKCELTLELFCFGVNGSGYRSICKKCRNTHAKEYRVNNPEKFKEKDRLYYIANKDQHNAKSKQYRDEHREEICEQKRGYYEHNRERILEYHQHSKEKRNVRVKARRITDTVYRIQESLKSRLHYVLKETKGSRSSVYIGCSNYVLRTWLEFQFSEGITWDNYGDYWHVDHVIPIKAFDVRNKCCQFVCFHWSNLRPLSKRENMLKADKILVNDIEKHNIVLKRFINLHGYQPMPERAWWLRDELRYGKNPEDEFQAWLENEMGNPQPSS